MYNLTLTGTLSFGRGMDNADADFRVFSTCPEIAPAYDVLIFTDSKGSVSDIPGSPCWTDMLAEQLSSEGRSCLLIVRPKVLTTFFTLLNFMAGNRITFRSLITNVGFVDFTPKKEEYMIDIMDQAPTSEIRSCLSYRKLSTYQLSSGEEQPLYTFEYGAIEERIARLLAERFEYSLLTGTMEFSSDIPIPRQRPPEFFSQLRATNEFIFKVAQHSHSVHFVQPLKFPLSCFGEVLSLDAVHFTEYGHRKIYEILSPLVARYIVPRES